MANRAERKAARWNSNGPEGRLLQSLFAEKKIDATRNNLDYVELSIWEKYELFQKFTHKNFLPTYRRLAREWLMKSTKEGARRE